MRCVQVTEIRGQRIDVLCRDMRLACGEKPAREQLIDRENGGIRLIDMRSHPASHRCRVACHGVVVHQLGWRRHDLPSDDFTAVYDKRPARRT